MAEVVRAKDLPEKAASKAQERKRRRSARRLKNAKRDFDGKVFADLTAEEKDDLLRSLAIAAGIIEE